MRPAVHLVLAAVQLMFASLAIAGRFVLPRFPAGALVAIRILGATLVLFIVNAVTRRTWVWAARDLWRLAALGMLGIAANQTLFLYGLQHSTAINASILVSTVPVFTVLGSVLTGREPATPLVLAGVAIAALGTVYLIGPDRISLAPDLALGNALIVAGMVCNAAYFLYSKSVVGRYDSITVSFYVMLFASVGVLPFGLSASRNLDVSAVTPTVWGWVIYIVIFPTILTYLLNIWALQRASSNVVAVYIYLQPLFTAAVAPLLLSGEQLTTRAMVGGLTIFTGLGLVLWSERRLHRDIPIEPVGE
jgi:drug/metabolite transporter (DMT)-like permease